MAAGAANAKIVGTLATYPPRLSTLRYVVELLAPQVDVLNVVLNQYREVPDFLAAMDNVEAILPAEDTRDAGKFLPDMSGAEWVFLLDDDIIVPHDYVEKSLERIRLIDQDNAIYGYHGLLYERPRLRLSPRVLRERLLPNRRQVFRWKRIFELYNSLEGPVVVDELGSGVAVLPGRLVPPFSEMRSAQGFVDTRLARWCFDRSITPICLPRERGWLKEIRHGETLYRDFSMTFPEHVAEEIWSYAFRVSGRGEPPQPRGQTGPVAPKRSRGVANG